ncbi:MAG TPA: glycosyltransferase [Methylomirabilota bacterium]|nr:glycosyltransferase [Methylomirabilota bacterium]
MRIAFLRPRLGIGGSERLVVDAGLELIARGHTVTFFVPDADEMRQLDAVADRRLDVRNAGAFLPRAVASRLRAPAAIARAGYAARAMARCGPRWDVVVCDVVSHVVPLVRRLTAAPVVYYCHFPDLLLTPPRRALYALYRRPLDWLEERGLRAADRVVVNSRFTASVVRRTFPRLAGRRLDVIPPGVDLETEGGEGVSHAPVTGEILILSVSRFDAGKDLGLAVDALAHLRPRLSPPDVARVRLVLAGHYDERLAEQRAVMDGLRARVERHGVRDHVTFVISPSDRERRALLARCRCVVYTPAAEHFGIVPLEAMAAARPVIAVGHGGPTETIVDGVTGVLCPPTAEAFGDALAALLSDPERARRMGEAGGEHVRRNFSRRLFGDRLEALLQEVVSGG